MLFGRQIGWAKTNFCLERLCDFQGQKNPLYLTENYFFLTELRLRIEERTSLTRSLHPSPTYGGVDRLHTQRYRHTQRRTSQLID